MMEDEVNKVIMSVKTKHCELNAIPTSLLKVLLPSCLCIITKSSQYISRTGPVCNQWKTAIVRPLLKKPGLTLIEQNYCLVSSLNFISKIVERCMKQQFNRNCKNYNLLPEYQSVYRTNCSCETSLLKIVNDFLWG